MIKQNPFSIYDFLGYFIPGAITFYILIIFLNLDSINSLRDIIEITNKNEKLEFDKALFFILISYSLGHLISYISSITIERFSIWKYDYPSKYLLGLNKEQKFFPKGVRKRITIVRFVLAVIILPISVLDLLLGEYLFFKIFYTKKLDDFLVEVIKEKNLELLDQLYPPDYRKVKEYDFHRIISHYVYENSKNHQSKMTNYVALYGFLRAMSLISVTVFWILCLFCIKSCFIYWKFTIQNHTIISISDINPSLLLTTLVIGLVSYIYFMGFMKFYRRYTLEGYMLVAIDKDIITNSPKYNPPKPEETKGSFLLTLLKNWL